ncbi:MAG: helicase-related protein, partial [Vampirovibrionales bacterium]
GKLKEIVDRANQEDNPYEVIFVDEAHRFRNESTQAFTFLKELALHPNGTRAKFVLITATPLNNSFYDFYPLLTLFQDVKSPTIPGLKNLDAFFTKQRKRQKSTKGTDEHLETVKAISDEIREKILRHVMVRRTRGDIKKFFKSDLDTQGLKFPTIQPPERLIYQFDTPTDNALMEAIQAIKGLSYARYMPLLYLVGQLKPFEQTQQKNLGGFIRSLMIKRLESSKHAFEQTLTRMIESHTKFLTMADTGMIYISKDVDVNAYIADGDEAGLIAEFERLETQKTGNKPPKSYALTDFQPELLAYVKCDKQALENLLAEWKRLKTDFKQEAFLESLQKNQHLRTQKMIVFTESKETGEQLYQTLIQQYAPEEVFFYHSGGSKDDLSHVQQAFDPSCKHPTDKAKQCRILITTDVLAEGVNLHLANCLVNYDLPWNPTRVLQRVGRVNRVGTPHDSIHIFNFFPTAKTDEHLGLEKSIIAKIQAFHNALGEDAKYLSDQEELSAETLVKVLETHPDHALEEETDPELKYLSVIRGIRDEDPNLFEKIKRLPKKARTSHTVSSLEASDSTEGVITFLRRGTSKFFAMAGADTPTKRLPTFESAMRYLECSPETPQAVTPIPESFYKYLGMNKQAFELSLQEDSLLSHANKGQANSDYVKKALKGLLKNGQVLTHSNTADLSNLLKHLEQGRVPKTVINKLKKELETLKSNHSLEHYHVIKREADKYFVPVMPTPHHSKNTDLQQEVILSSFLVAGAIS